MASITTSATSPIASPRSAMPPWRRRCSIGPSAGSISATTRRRSSAASSCAPRFSLDDTLRDLAAAIASLQSAGKVGAIGYCWGGSLAFLAATRLSGLACAIGYYGGMIAGHAGEKPKVPVLLHFGEKDHGIPMTDVQKVIAARPETKVYIYPADHGFSCDERRSFDPASHELALERSLVFMRKHLGG